MLTTTVCAALSAAGLAVAFLTAYRRRFAAATRIAGVALLPIGLAMSGLVGLGAKVGRAVGGWAADLVLRPTVWIGVAVLAVAVVLYVAGRFAGRRATARGEGPTGVRAGRKPAVAPGAAAPSLGAGERAASGPGKQAGGAGKPTSGGGSGDADDFSDIEAILKKHGI